MHYIFIYIILITITILIQSIISYFITNISFYIKSKNIPFNKTIVLVLVMYIVFIALFIDVIIWAVILVFIGIFDSFSYALAQCLDYFTTLGTGDPLPSPYKLLGPIMALNGFIIISFSVAYIFYVLHLNFEDELIFSWMTLSEKKRNCKENKGIVSEIKENKEIGDFNA